MVLHTHYDADSRTWSGQPIRPIYNPNVNIATVLFNSLQRNPRHIGQINANSGHQLTNEQIRLNAVRVAMHLQRGHLAVKKNDVIAIVSKNHELLSAVVLAAFALAAPINTLDPDFREDEIAHMFRLTQPKYVFCDSDSIAEVRKALLTLSLDTDTKVITVDRKVDAFDAVEDMLELFADEHLFVPNEIGDGRKHPVVIVCTSGTTGHPKGVSLPHAMLLSQISNSLLLSGDVYLSFSSLYWLTGISALVDGTLAGVTRIITTQPFSPDLMLQLIERYGVTFTLTAPTHVARLLQSPLIGTTNLSTLRNYICGGSAVAPELLEKFNKLLPTGVLNAYGLSEVSGIVTANEARLEGSVGTLKDGMVVQIVDEVGQRCGIFNDGEILVKAPFTFLGYWGDEAATAEAVDPDGWLHTGDVGHFDENGFLYLVDRKKDILKYRNYQISPSELENLILRCDGVAEVCVVGVPDVVSTDLPAAVIVKAAGKEVNIEEITALIRDQLSDAKQLRGGIYFVKSLPLTPSGKVLKRKVKDIAIECFNKQ